MRAGEAAASHALPILAGGGHEHTHTRTRTHPHTPSSSHRPYAGTSSCLAVNPCALNAPFSATRRTSLASSYTTPLHSRLHPAPGLQRQAGVVDKAEAALRGGCMRPHHCDGTHPCTPVQCTTQPAHPPATYRPLTLRPAPAPEASRSCAVPPRVRRNGRFLPALHACARTIGYAPTAPSSTPPRCGPPAGKPAAPCFSSSSRVRPSPARASHDRGRSSLFVRRLRKPACSCCRGW